MRARDEAKEKPGTKNGGGAKGTLRPYTFHPTKEQRNILRDRSLDTYNILQGLSDWLRLGHRITLGHSDRGDGLYAVIRDGTAKWDNAMSVFVYHSDLAKVLQGLDYFLTEVAPEFPAVPSAPNTFDDEW